MRTLWTTLVLTAVLTGAAQAQDTPAATATTGATAAGELEDLVTMTCAQAWSAAGREEKKFVPMLIELAKLSLDNRDLTLPDVPDLGKTMGAEVRRDCEADAQELLYAVVDRTIRRHGVAGEEEG